MKKKCFQNLFMGHWMNAENNSAKLFNVVIFHNFLRDLTSIKFLKIEIHADSFKKLLRSIFIYWFIFREKGREGEREGNISVWLSLTHPLMGTWHVTQACALNGNWNSDRPSDLEAGVQSTVVSKKLKWQNYIIILS